MCFFFYCCWVNIPSGATPFLIRHRTIGILLLNRARCSSSSEFTSLIFEAGFASACLRLLPFRPRWNPDTPFTPPLEASQGSLSIRRGSELKKSIWNTAWNGTAGDVASERLKHARFGNNMTALEIKETACARVDEKQQKRKKKKKRGREDRGRKKSGEER